MEERQAKQIKPDAEMAASLQKTSANKAFSSQQLELREETIASKISLQYDAVRELLESIALLRGFKIYNHVCYTSFLIEVLEQSEVGEAFDRLRKIRNDINYYGKEISLEEAKEVLQHLEQLRRTLQTLLRSL